MLDDGGEVDVDLGNYERFLNVRLTSDNSITTGKIYKHVCFHSFDFFLANFDYHILIFEFFSILNITLNRYLTGY